MLVAHLAYKFGSAGWNVKTDKEQVLWLVYTVYIYTYMYIYIYIYIYIMR